MLIFLYGPDTYRSRRKLKEIIEEYQKIYQTGLNLKYLLYPNFSFNDLKEETQQVSMFEEKKLIVLFNAFSDHQFKKDFLKNKKYFLNQENIILFYQEDSPPLNDSLYSFLRKNAKCQEFKQLEGFKLIQWTKKEFQRDGQKFEEGVPEKLVKFIGNDLWRVRNEINKLIAFRKNRIVKKTDINLLVRPQVETDIFKTIDAIARRDKTKAIQLLKEHLKNGDSSFYLFSMIIFQFRNLLMLKSFGSQGNYLILSKKLKMHPYLIRKSLALSRNFTLDTLKKIYRKIFEIDIDIKTGKIDPDAALDVLIAEI